ncbi:MAG: thiamine biosynthesis protein ApbE [Bacteroidetes bacterium 4572_77]|nr:MAG: thiamine biosynthesis protein ApbE [Bacteroidetes bacterium 4572_77]
MNIFFVKISFWFLLIAVLFSACESKPQKKIQLSGTAQGTYYAISYYDSQDRDFQKAIDSILSAFDQSVSVYQTNSVVSRINRNDSTVVLDEWFLGNFNLAQQIAQETNGSFDITIAPIANIWGFGTFEKPDSINPQLIDSLKQYVDYRKVKLLNQQLQKENPAIQLNFNAIAQGYAVDVLADYLTSQQISNYLIDIGGEIVAKGQKPNGDKWKIGLEIPEDDAQNRTYNSIIVLEDKAVATSGNYRKFYVIDGVKYAHSLNPKTAYPVQHSLLSATVIAPNAAQADAYATAFMVMGVEKALAFVNAKPNLQAYFVFEKDGALQISMSEGFEAYLQ